MKSIVYIVTQFTVEFTRYGRVLIIGLSTAINFKKDYYEDKTIFGVIVTEDFLLRMTRFNNDKILLIKVLSYHHQYWVLH